MLENKQYSQWNAEINRMLEYKHVQTMYCWGKTEC
jgi:hypothetical protein